MNALSFCKNKVLIIWNWIWQEENQQSMTSLSESEANVWSVMLITLELVGISSTP